MIFPDLSSLTRILIPYQDFFFSSSPIVGRLVIPRKLCKGLLHNYSRYSLFLDRVEGPHVLLRQFADGACLIPENNSANFGYAFPRILGALSWWICDLKYVKFNCRISDTTISSSGNISGNWIR